MARVLVDSPWPRRLGLFLLVLGSACAAPLGEVWGLTITGDRLLGLAALAGCAVLAVRRRFYWTRVHTALGLFVAAQLFTTVINARTWTPGSKFVTVYLLGFACFALTAEWARGVEGRRWLTSVWIGVAAALSLVGTVAAVLSNVYQHPFWGSADAQPLQYERVLYAARATFNEWNLFSSFLLIPFSLGLWAWRREAAHHWRLVVAVVAMFFGLVMGITRVAWLSMLVIFALWWRARGPRSAHVVALVSGLAAACLLLTLTLSIGPMPVWPRLFERSSNLEHRMVINRVTVNSWLDRPVSDPGFAYFGPAHVASGPATPLVTTRNVVLGHGAGSVNRVSIVLPVAGLKKRIWNGNVVLFVLHDSGVLGLAALVGVLVVLAGRSRRALALPGDEETSATLVPLLASGVALCFAYQFTHGLWLMYPYVYLGFLTAVLETGAVSPGARARPEGAPAPPPRLVGAEPLTPELAARLPI